MAVETDAACRLAEGREYALAFGFTRFASGAGIAIRSEREMEALEWDLRGKRLTLMSASAQEVAVSISPEAGYTLRFPPDMHRRGPHIKLPAGSTVLGISMKENIAKTR